MDDREWLAGVLDLGNLARIYAIVKYASQLENDTCFVPDVTFDQVLEATRHRVMNFVYNGTLHVPVVGAAGESYVDFGADLFFDGFLRKLLQCLPPHPSAVNPLCREIVDLEHPLFELFDKYYDSNRLRWSYRRVLYYMAGRTDTDPLLIESLSKYQPADVWLQAIRNPILPRKRIDALMSRLLAGRFNRDTEPRVAEALLDNPALTEQDLAMLALSDKSTLRDRAMRKLECRREAQGEMAS